MKNIVLFFFVVSMLLGCAASGPLYQAPPPAPKGYGTLIIYRVHSFRGRAWSIDFAVDQQQEAASLRDGGYTSIFLSSGKHFICRLGAERKAVAVINVVEGESYYLRYSPAVVGEVGYRHYAVLKDHLIEQILTSEAINEIREYKYQPPTIALIGRPNERPPIQADFLELTICAK